MATQKPIISVVFDEETLKRIEDFQFFNRLSSRSKAVNELVKLALDEHEEFLMEHGNEILKDEKEFDAIEEMEKLKAILEEMQTKMIKHRKEGK